MSRVTRGFTSCRIGVCLLAAIAGAGPPATAAIGTAFTYQGRIAEGVTAVSGALDLELRLYDAATGGVQVGSAIPLADVSCAAGLFTVTLDFGTAAFNGDPRWLEIRVSPDFPAIAYTVLVPRQALAPTPYAIFATDATHAVDATNAVNATLAVNATQAANADLLDNLDSLDFSLVTHGHDASTIQGIADGLVAFGAGGGTALAGDAGGLSYDSATNALTGANDVDAAGVYRIGGVAVLRVNPALDNTFVGQAGNATTTGVGNTAVGDGALVAAGSVDGNTAVGANALAATVGVAGNIPPRAGDDNTAVGVDALASNTLGTDNTAVGAGALATSVGFVSGGNGSRNSAFGSGALHLAVGGNNTAVGALALSQSMSGSDNTAVGVGAMQAYAFGSRNTALGANALETLGSGDDNTAVGAGAMGAATFSSRNTAVGEDALRLVSGSDNTAVGRGAGMNLTSAFSNILLGTLAGSALSSGSFNILIGHPGISPDSNTIRIGSAQTATFVAGIFNSPIGASGLSVFVDANGKLGTTVSSRRFKEDIRDMGADADRLLDLRPVVFRYRDGVVPDGEPRTEQYGLIAEEVADVNPDWAVRDADGAIVSVRYDQVNAALLGLVQRQQAEIDALTAQRNDLAARLTRLEGARLDRSLE